MTLAAYGPSLSYGFVYEDLNDPATFFGLTVGDVLGSFYKMPFRILPRLVDAVCLAIGGGAPLPYHVASLAVHSLNGLLVYAVLGGWAGVVAAGLWWLHPLQVESVAYISALPDAMAAMGILGALALSRRWPWTAWLGLVFAVCSKDTAVVAYALIPLWLIMNGRPPSRAFWYGWFYCGAFSILFALGHLGSASRFSGFSMTSTLRQFAVLGQYLALVVWPVGLTIDHDYAAATPLVGALVAGAMLVALGWSRSRFLALWIVLAFLPRLLFAYGDGMHEHHWPIALIGIALVCGESLAGRTQVCQRISPA